MFPRSLNLILAMNGVKMGVAGGRKLPLDETRICGTFNTEGNFSFAAAWK